MEMSWEVRCVVVIDTGTNTESWSESPHFKEDAGAAKSLSGPSTAPVDLCAQEAYSPVPVPWSVRQ